VWLRHLNDTKETVEGGKTPGKMIFKRWWFEGKASEDKQFFVWQLQGKCSPCEPFLFSVFDFDDPSLICFWVWCMLGLNQKNCCLSGSFPSLHELTSTPVQKDWSLVQGGLDCSCFLNKQLHSTLWFKNSLNCWLGIKLLWAFCPTVRGHMNIPGKIACYF
jgi:hypothetical protein